MWGGPWLLPKALGDKTERMKRKEGRRKGLMSLIEEGGVYLTAKP